MGRERSSPRRNWRQLFVPTSPSSKVLLLLFVCLLHSKVVTSSDPFLIRKTAIVQRFSGRAGRRADGMIHKRIRHPSADSELYESLQLETISRGGEAKGTSGEGTASIAASVFNLVNNVAGAGILTLAAGMASGTGWFPAVIICALLGWASAHTFNLIGEACELTGEMDFKGLWGRTIGKNTTYMVDSMIAIMCLAVSVIYSGILGDVFTPLLKAAGLPDNLNGRTSNIIALTIAVLFPLSLLKNLSALAFTSILGFSAIMYTVLFIVIRFLDGTYALEPVGKFVADDVITPPAFTKSSLWNFDFTSLVLASNLGLAYIAHYNGPVFYRELKDTSSPRFRKMVSISFVILAALYVVTMCAGYGTFGDVCQGNLLLNYHPDDLLSTLGRVATGFSILFGFPLVICGAREAIIGAASSLGYPGVGEEKNHALLASAILAFVTLISVTVEDVSLIVGLTGAALGSFIVYICPSIIYSKAVGLVKGMDSKEYEVAKRNLAFVPFGCFIGALGVYMTIKESMGKK